MIFRVHLLRRESTAASPQHPALVVFLEVCAQTTLALLLFWIRKQGF